MHGRSCRRLLVLCPLILTPAFLWGQAKPDRSATGRDQSQFGPPSEATLPPARTTRFPYPEPGSRPAAFGFTELARAAGIIFSGTVASVAPLPASPNQPIEAVSITFHVEQAIRGATPGADLTVSQWIATWAGGQRYRVGERVLLFLYPASKLGLTSSVGASLGRFRIDSHGRVPISPQQFLAFREDPALGGKSSVSFSDLVRAVRQAVPAPPVNSWTESHAQ